MLTLTIRYGILYIETRTKHKNKFEGGNKNETNNQANERGSKRIKEMNHQNLTSEQVVAIMNRTDELLKAAGHSINAWWQTNAKKKDVENHLTCYINANYDITGDCY